MDLKLPKAVDTPVFQAEITYKTGEFYPKNRDLSYPRGRHLASMAS
jgi:hypothetical protein